jgi:hypothetical protein
MINGITPCRPEVLQVIEALASHFDDDEIEGEPTSFVFEQDNLNPNVFLVAVLDEDNHANVAMVGWGDEQSEIFMFCHIQAIENHDIAEGVSESDSKCWLVVPDLKMLILFLDGSVREVINENIRENS